MEEPKCPDCGAWMRIVVKPKWKRDGKPRQFWGCVRYPECRKTVRAKRNGTPVAGG